ncbi:hypothetical protein [Deefgea sp. CFH1-16]|uniref:portal protein n=1 Tax=Deefgea sp. CFH1-16 TaxID=2675457 RepID=UPI0015F624A9|nr:hypothetical protein [Deefgea sp. CFH1-16]MBM5575824.1 hypothetical protein [Deefgea sp. CFH1-16]
MAERLSGIGQRLQGQITELVIERDSIEQRMLTDLRQYNGKYEADVLLSIKATGGSEAFVNLTRAKTNTQIARLSDTVLPTDDNNWGIAATPIPELADFATSTKPIGMTPEGAEIQERDLAQGTQSAADDCAAKMQKLMEDQLTECNFNEQSRLVINDALIVGTGVLKGVEITAKTETRWKKIAGLNGQSIREMVKVMKPKPIGRRVDPFDFFPDMSATCIEDAEFTFERHYISRKQLRELAKDPSFLREQIRLILDAGEAGSKEPTHLQQRREMSGTQSVKSNRYELWEYYGSLKPDDLAACGCEVGEDYDSLDEIPVCLWFCEGKVIKATQAVSDTGDLPYSVFTPETDGTSLFGYGIPYVMASSQRVANSIWRAALDNVAWAVRGLWVVDANAGMSINTIDGSLSPGAVVTLNSSMSVADIPFRRIDVNPHVDQLLALFNLANQLIDQETQTPLIAQGEGQNYLNQTASGTSMMLNQANTVLRRMVKRFDDQLTKPFIRRLYDYNMQYHEDDSIKGDYEVVARGTSALLEKEQQAMALMGILDRIDNPVIASGVDKEGLLSELSRVMRLPKSTVKSADKMAQEAQQAPPQDPRVAIDQQKLQQGEMKLQLEGKKIEQMAQDSQNDLQRTMLTAQGAAESNQLQYQLAMAELAERRNITVQQLEQEFGIKRMELDNANQLFNAEAQLKLQTGHGI